MTTADILSDGPFDELALEAKGLFTQLDSAFEGEFNPEHHQTDLSFTVGPEHPAYKHIPETTQDSWQASISYIPRLEKLGFTYLNIPLSGGRRFALTRFKAYPDQFYPSVHDSTGNQISISQNPDFIANSDTITMILDEAGIGMPELFTSPQDLQLALAGLKTQSEAWRTEETVTYPLGIDRQLLLRRTLEAYAPKGKDEVPKIKLGYKQSGYLKRAQAPATKTSTTLQAIRERIDPTSGRRYQVVIDFKASDYEVDAPTIFGRTLMPDNIQVEGSDSFRYTVDGVYVPLGEPIDLIRSMANVIFDAQDPSKDNLL